MTYRTLAFAGALCCALAAPPAFCATRSASAQPLAEPADPIADFFASFDPPARETRHPARNGWRRVREKPARAIEPNGSPLIAVAQRYLGSGNFTGLRAPLCMAAMRIWLARAGYEAPRSNRAIDGLRIGRPSAPHVGAIAVMPHHIGVVVGFSRRGPVILSGNHRHRVGVGVYPARRIIAYRSPA